MKSVFCSSGGKIVHHHSELRKERNTFYVGIALLPLRHQLRYHSSFTALHLEHSEQMTERKCLILMNTLKKSFQGLLFMRKIQEFCLKIPIIDYVKIFFSLYQENPLCFHGSLLDHERM